MRIIYTCLISCLLLSGGLQAQHLSNPFKKTAPESIAVSSRSTLPQGAVLFETNFQDLEKILRQAPQENEAHNFSIDLPVSADKTVPFAVWHVGIMHPDLAARYPEIQTYAGEALDGSGLMVRLTTSPYLGVDAMFLQANGETKFLNTVEKGQTGHYALYAGEQVTIPQMAQDAHCGVQDHEIDLEASLSAPAHTQSRSADPVPLRTYRYGCATTGEFGQDNGGTVPSVLAVVASKTNQIAGPIERDLALRLELIASNDLIIFTDPDNDPYSTSSLSNWLPLNVVTLNNIIGIENYDLGHVLGRGTGSGTIGLASLNSACTTNKASGATSDIPALYNTRMIGTYAHEVGHQLAGTHTYNFCPPNDRTDATAFEPASGSTIMSYGGVCGGQNIVNNVSLYYHNVSLNQMQNFLTTGVGSGCGTLTMTNNTTPEASVVSPAGRFIPISTPFVLKGAATDAEGDMLTYCWEQFDLGESVPLGSEGIGSPLFRSFPPSSSPDRTIPRLITLVDNTNDPTEVLPTMTRDLNFRMTVRDNNSESGGTDWANYQLKVTDQAGPFVVENPSAANITWFQDAYAEVTWDVANTDQAPVSCSRVNILLSTDGGFTYPVTLASDIANNGIAYVQVPNDINTNFARVRIDAADNVFFDISNNNFSIQPATVPGVSIGLSTTGETVCLPEVFTVEVLSSSLAGFSGNIALDISSGLPAGAVATFNPSTIAAGENSILTIDMSNVSDEGVFSVNVRATPDGASEVLLPLDIRIVSNDFSAVALTSPADGAGGITQTPVLRWNGSSDADFYEVEVATNPGFGANDLLETRSNITVDSFRVSTILPKGNVYYWRMRPVNDCGAGPWFGPNAFAIGQDVCNRFQSTDLPKNITPGAAVTVESIVTIPAGIVVNDVNVTRVKGFHEFFAHLDVRLESPLGTQVLLFNASCGTFNGFFDIGFDDAALNPFGCPPPNNGASFKPFEELAAFNNTDGGGEWKLKMRDNFVGAGGQLEAFELEICSSTSLTGPAIVNNNPLSLNSGTNAAITTDLLRAEDANNGPDELVYSLMTVPQFGELQKNWTGKMEPGDQFTQTELNNGAIRFFDYGNNPSASDGFRFSVTDNEAGLVTGTFNIQPSALSTNSPVDAIQFGLAPNPSTGRVQVIFSENTTSEGVISVYSLDGQRIYSQKNTSVQTNVLLNLSHLPNGVYTVRVENEAGSGIRKLIINR